MLNMKKKEKHNCRVVDGIEVCGMEKETSFSIGSSKQAKYGLLVLIVFWGVMSLASFFYGWGSGGFDLGMKWGGYTLALCLVSMGFFVPILGIVMAATFPSITGNLMSLSSITPNYWIDTINTILLSVGIAVQVIVIAVIVISIIMMAWIKSNI